MHIVHICLHFNTIIEYQELALAREQLRTGHKVSVVTSDWHPNFTNYDTIYKPILGERYIGTGVFFEEGITIYRLKLLSVPSIFRRLKGAKKIIKSISPDLVICHGFEVGLILFQASKAKCKVIVDSHQMPLHVRGLNKTARAKFILNNYLSKAKGIYIRLHKRIECAGVTEDSVDYLIKSFCPKKRIHLIPLAADTKSFFPDKTLKNSMRRMLGFSEKDVVLIFTGKIQENKGVHLIIESMASLANEGITNYKLLIVGNGPLGYINKINDLIQAFGLKDKVVTLDFADKETLNEYFNAANIAVYPKEVTISHMEAMATGLPILVENLKGIGHRIKLGNGFGISNSMELTDRLRELSIDKELLQKMGKLSFLLIKEQYNWININKKLLLV